MANELTIAQWYSTSGLNETFAATFRNMRESDRSQCFQFGCLVNWSKLPQIAKDVVADMYAEIVS